MTRNALTGVAAGAAAIAAAVAVPLALAASTTSVTLKEFSVTPAPKSAKAGKVTFAVKNAGSLPHELVVVKTNVAPGKLPVKGSQASEKGRVGEVELKPGKSAKLTLTLKAGKYVLLCNVKGHYQAGQFTGFVVK